MGTRVRGLGLESDFAGLGLESAGPVGLGLDSDSIPAGLGLDSDSAKAGLVATLSRIIDYLVSGHTNY